MWFSSLQGQKGAMHRAHVIIEVAWPWTAHLLQVLFLKALWHEVINSDLVLFTFFRSSTFVDKRRDGHKMSPAGLTSTRTSLNKKHSGELSLWYLDVVVIPSDFLPPYLGLTKCWEGWMLLSVTVNIQQCQDSPTIVSPSSLVWSSAVCFICWTTRSGLHSISQHDLGVSTFNAEEWPRHTIPSLLSGSLRPGGGLAVGIVRGGDQATTQFGWFKGLCRLSSGIYSIQCSSIHIVTAGLWLNMMGGFPCTYCALDLLIRRRIGFGAVVKRCFCHSDAWEVDRLQFHQSRSK